MEMIERQMDRAIGFISITSALMAVFLGFEALSYVPGIQFDLIVPEIQKFDAEAQGLCMSFEDSDACDHRLYDLGDIDAACEGIECLVSKGGAQ